jgi:transcriptional regulator with XRE-family HTH domain
MKKTLASSIGILMEKAGLSIAELAQTLGLPKATLHKIVTGKSARPRSKTLSVLSEYFKVPVVQLLQGDIDEYTYRDKIRSVPIIEWDNIHDWLNGRFIKERFQHATPTNLDISEKSFALIFNDMSSTLFRSNSVLLFDPTLEVKDGAYVLVKLSEHPDILLRQIICDVSNTKHLKSLNQEFSTSIKKLEPADTIIAILVMTKTLYYHK